MCSVWPPYVKSHVNGRGLLHSSRPVEREMRKLNRRADIGARWSPKGLENVLKLLFHQWLNESPNGIT